MNFERAAQLTVLIPLAHLLVSFLFLFGYSSGFGGGIGSLFSVTDIFGISLTDLTYVYLGGFIIPLAMSAHFFRAGYRSPEALARESGDERAIQRVESDKRHYKRMGIALMVIFVLSAFPAALLSIKYDHRFPYPEFAPFVSFVLPVAWYRYARNLKTTVAVDRFIAILLTLIGSAILFGLTRGQSERRYDFAAFSDSRIACGDYVVLRRVSERFLAVSASGERAVINELCHPVFKLPARRSFEQISTWGLAQRYFGWDNEKVQNEKSRTELRLSARLPQEAHPSAIDN